ncbi:helix-turn-helix domain-containing protein [Thermophilibacter sp.]
MAIPRFSEMLVARRRELGLSIAQASRTLRLREDVLVAFEEGDFDHMPQSGYAQGMLSSYARYLGLNARQVTDLFQEEVYEYRHGTASHELRRRTRQTQSGHGLRGYDVVNEEGSRPKAYVEYRPLLPTSGGPAGDMGDFATTAPARPRRSVPLAGTGAPAPGTRSSASSWGARDEASERSLARERPYNAPGARTRPSPATARRRATGRRREGDQASRLISEGQQYVTRRDDARASLPSGRLYLRDDVSTRRVRAGEFTDDMRYDDRANPYAPASTLSGRRSSRNIAPVERPNVRRRATRTRGSGQGARGRSRGGALSTFLSDPRRALLAIVALLALVLTLILVFSVRSCVDARNQPTGPTAVVPVDTTGTSDDAGDQGGATDEGDTDEGTADDAPDDETSGTPAATDGSDATDGDAATDEPTETVVEVSVAEGQVSWVEITCDGASDVANSVTGPWSKSYTVHESITIQVANPDAVTVTNNGEKVALSSRAGGLGAVTIEGTPAPDDATGAAAQDAAQ